MTVLERRREAWTKRAKKLSDRHIFLASLQAWTEYSPEQRKQILELYEEFHANLDKLEED